VNLNYSYRALVITSLLFGILFLAFKSITLSKYTVVKEENFDVEYTEEDLLLNEEIASNSILDSKVETNRAFNEAEKFISEIENERVLPSETSEEKNQNDEGSINDSSGKSAVVKEKVKKETVSKSVSDTENKSVGISSKKNSTVSYRLLNRSALDLPNPVYTCEGFGKILINIEVNETGRVIKATYNQNGSTTKNECLIDNALDYAKSAQFTYSAQKAKQLGTITYNFPGQQ